MNATARGACPVCAAKQHGDVHGRGAQSGDVPVRRVDLVEIGFRGQRVFKAHAQVLGHAVAVKIFLTGVAATDARRQHHEIMTLAGFSHRSLVMVYNVGEHEGRAFFVMQLVEGRTLADRLHEDPCPRRILRSWVSRWPMPWPTSTDGGHPPRRQTRQRATRSARPPPPQ